MARRHCLSQLVAPFSLSRGLALGASLLALLLPAAPAGAASVRLETVGDAADAGARVIYVGDERSNNVEIDLARNENIDSDAARPRQVVGFLVTGALSPGPGCEPIDGSEIEHVCRVADGMRLRAPRVYAGGGRDSIAIYVPRRDAIVYGGPGHDYLSGPYGADGETLLPSEVHGGPGNDDFDAAGVLYGGPGDDDLSDTGAPSRILAGPGNDWIWGSEGADVINAGPGRDEVLAWGGDDVIRTIDGQIDTVECDDGRDSLTADGRDEADPYSDNGPFTDCERLDRRGEPLLTPFRFYGWEFESYVTVVYACPPDGPIRCIGTIALRRGGRLIAHRRLRERAGNWGIVDFPLGLPRIRRLLDTEIRITVRWRDRSGDIRSLATTDEITEPDYEDN